MGQYNSKECEHNLPRPKVNALLRGPEGEEDGMVFASTREEEPHCKGAEVMIGRFLSAEMWTKSARLSGAP